MRRTRSRTNIRLSSSGAPPKEFEMLLALLVLMTLFAAYSNGANDNFKGVANALW